MPGKPRIARPFPARSRMSAEQNSRDGSAYLVVLGVLVILMVIAFTLSKTTVAGRWLTVRSSNDKKAMDCAESATNLVYRMVAEQTNDPKMLYDIISFKKVDLDSWFWKFRLPQAMGAGGVDPLAFKNKNITEAQTSGNGLGMELSVGPEMLLKLQQKYDNKELSDLSEMIKDMGGNVKISVLAKIEKSYGILPKTENYDIPGVTLDTSKASQFSDLKVGEFLNSLMDDSEFKLDITKMLVNCIPEVNFGDIVKKMVDKISINADFEWVAIPIPIGKIVGSLLKGLMSKLLGDNATLRGFLSKTLLKDFKLAIDLSDLKKSIREKILDIFPTELKAFVGQVGWGVTVEKIGIFQVETTVEYQPQGAAGTTFTKKLLTQRDFRVADIQPIAPDYSFFVANSALLFEDPKTENTTGFSGGKSIEWDKGMGSLVIHNLTFFDPEIFNKLKDFAGAVTSMNLEKIGNSFFLPGLVRINGTDTTVIRLNFGLLDFFSGGTFVDAMKACEIVALLVNDKTKNKHCKPDGSPATQADHTFIPGVGESLYGTSIEGIPPIGGWIALLNALINAMQKVLEDPNTYGEAVGDFEKETKAVGDSKDKAKASLNNLLSSIMENLSVPHFDWPWLTDSKIWIPVPKFYNKTHFFGDFHAEFPLSMRIEGNVWKKFSRVKMPMFRIWVCLNWLFSCPNIDITLPPIPLVDNIVEPYGYCSYPPLEKSNSKADAAQMAVEWSPNDPKNLPANVYSPMQYLKKASYYYEKTSDFARDIENRTVEVIDTEGKTQNAFVCDGVTFVECKDGQGLFLREMKVVGRGIIVAAGNIHLKSITRVDAKDQPPTMLSIVARNGALINNGNNCVEAALYGDRGLINPFYGKLKICGNLVVNQFNREDCQGTVNVHFESNRTHSSFMSYFKNVAKYDPTRYHVSLSKKWRTYEFVKN
ncbi:MAG: hypothetical protein WA705_02595 [Candidatus Ozemobacteraceae bacterium]